MNVSFFIAAYNCEFTIEETVNSIMDSNFEENDELIIVNDGSTEGTISVLNKLKEKYPLIKIINHVRNKGGAAARNTAVENAKNELLFCLDSDNVLENNSIKPLKKYLIKEEAQIACFHKLKYFSSSIAVIDEIWSFEPFVFTIEHLLAGRLSPGASGNYLFTKTSWQKSNGYTEDLGALDTWAFGFKQLMEHQKMVIMPDSYYYHRRGHQSYYLRDAWNRRKSVSYRLIKLIIDYTEKFNPDDVNYIFSKKGRYTWYDNLNKRSIRLIGDTKPIVIWSDHQLKTNLFGNLKNMIRYCISNFKRIKNEL